MAGAALLRRVPTPLAAMFAHAVTNIVVMVSHVSGSTHVTQLLATMVLASTMVAISPANVKAVTLA